MTAVNLDFLNLRSSNYKEEFERIAEKLCFECVLCANENKFAIVDVEFYYFSENDHPDPFVYSSPSKRNHLMGEWFFHYSGIDITFGKGENRGGILIRGIKELKSSEYIIGTLKSMYAILNCFPSINSGKGLLLSLEPNPSLLIPKLPKPELKKGARIGLEKDKKGNKVETYRAELYRFTADYEIIAKLIKSKKLQVASQMKKNFGVL